MHKLLSWAITTSTVVLAPLALASLAQAQAPASMSYKPAANNQYAANPAVPACAKMAVIEGDPSTGAAILSIKTTGNCTIPWHWHTSNERLMIVSGSAKAEMKDMPASTLHKGDFVALPAKGIHQFTSDSDTEFFLVTDAPFDIHYVDKSGTEITPEQALKKAPAM